MTDVQYTLCDVICHGMLGAWDTVKVSKFILNTTLSESRNKNDTVLLSVGQYYHSKLLNRYSLHLYGQSKLLSSFSFAFHLYSSQEVKTVNSTSEIRFYISFCLFYSVILPFCVPEKNSRLKREGKYILVFQ